MGAIVNQMFVEVLHIVRRQEQERNLGGTQTASLPSTTPTDAPSSTTPAVMSQTGNPSSGPTSSPLLFFVALGFGVVFTNLWIIVGVKYCFRYNARNRAIRNGEEPDPISLENMPAPRHRRRREKKLMSMDEVNERFPLTKYKNWVAARASEGLPTAGGVTASAAAVAGTVASPPSRAGSVRDEDGVVPSSPVETKHSVTTRPATAASDVEVVAPPSADKEYGTETKNPAQAVEKETQEDNKLEEVRTTASTVNDKNAAANGEEDEDDDDHIHTAVPPELLTNPGDTCAICIDTLEEDDDIRGLTCGHAFHAGCLDPWLTSRRACCPLCKADYYTPKPRPEGETAETERTSRRREARMNLPQQPTSTWTGIRGSPRLLLLPGRLGGTQVYPSEGDRRGRRARRAAAGAQPSGTAGGDGAGAVANEDAAAPRRWRPSNPFNSISMPRFPGRTRQTASANEPTAAAEPSPSQLEAGVVR